MICNTPVGGQHRSFTPPPSSEAGPLLVDSLWQAVLPKYLDNFLKKEYHLADAHMKKARVLTISDQG